jgi:hypothetical protein
LEHGCGHVILRCAEEGSPAGQRMPSSARASPLGTFDQTVETSVATANDSGWRTATSTS